MSPKSLIEGLAMSILAERVTNATSDVLPPPLVPAYVDLRNFSYMPIELTRLFNSRFNLLATDAEWRAGVLLWLKSFHQVPAASLPDDDYELCKLAEFGRSMKEWLKIKKGALYGWIKCSDGRLYHPVVAEKAMEAWSKKVSFKKRALKANEARWGKRYQLGLDHGDESARRAGTSQSIETGKATQTYEGWQQRDRFGEVEKETETLNVQAQTQDATASTETLESTPGKTVRMPQHCIAGILAKIAKRRAELAEAASSSQEQAEESKSDVAEPEKPKLSAYQYALQKAAARKAASTVEITTEEASKKADTTEALPEDDPRRREPDIESPPRSTRPDDAEIPPAQEEVRLDASQNLGPREDERASIHGKEDTPFQVGMPQSVHPSDSALYTAGGVLDLLAGVGVVKQDESQAIESQSMMESGVPIQSMESGVPIEKGADRIEVEPCDRSGGNQVSLFDGVAEGMAVEPDVDKPKKPEKTDSTRGSRLPPDWVLPEKWKLWAIDYDRRLDPEKVAERFRDYWVAKPGADGRKTDWFATWRNWYRREIERLDLMQSRAKPRPAFMDVSEHNDRMIEEARRRIFGEKGRDREILL